MSDLCRVALLMTIVTTLTCMLENLHLVRRMIANWWVSLHWMMDSEEEDDGCTGRGGCV